MATEHTGNVWELVKRRRYCFVIMPFGSLGLFYRHLREVIDETSGLLCIRADEVPGNEQSLLEKIHDLIRGAELVIGELSTENANVYYEVGYAAGVRKKVLIVCAQGTRIPTDFQGLERIEYVDSPGKLPEFDEQLCKYLATLIDWDIQLLRAMLVGPEPSPSQILCSPNWAAGPPGRSGRALRRTYGDYLGVVGVLHALGRLLEKQPRPELLHARHVADDVLHWDCNHYVIASPRANWVAKKALEWLQEGEENPWRFESDEEKDIEVLVGPAFGGSWEHRVEERKRIPDEDYGLVLRGPHPEQPNKIILVMAGTRSLGTGAACLAATDPSLIQDIRNRLKEVNLGDKSRTIWALVHATPHPEDHHLSVDGVRIEDVGVIG